MVDIKSIKKTKPRPWSELLGFGRKGVMLKEQPHCIWNIAQTTFGFKKSLRTEEVIM